MDLFKHQMCIRDRYCKDLSGDLEGCANHLDYHDCGYGLKLFTGSIFSLGADLQGSRCEEFFSGLSGLYPSDSSDFIDSLLL